MKYIVNSNSIVLFIDNSTQVVLRTDGRYPSIVAALSLPDVLADRAIGDIIHGKAETLKNDDDFDITDDTVTFRGCLLPATLAQKVLRLHKEGFPLGPFKLFWENMTQNPSLRAVHELYNFLGYKELPITEDGHFLAYKGVRGDFYSDHGNSETTVLQGTVDEHYRIYNGVGETIQVERNCVDDDPTQLCSTGLHIGSLDYARDHYDTVVVVKVHPKDVVSVPLDYNGQKCRVCQYTVVSIYGEEIAPALVNDKLESSPTIFSGAARTREILMKEVAAYVERRCMASDRPITIRSIRDNVTNHPESATTTSILEALVALEIPWHMNNGAPYVGQKPSRDYTKIRTTKKQMYSLCKDNR